MLEWWARLGYATRGVVYLIVGGLAAIAALGRGGGTTGAKGALQTILQQPLGTFLLAVVVIGMIGYAIWRLVQAILDTDHHGSGVRALTIRAGLLASAIAYATLAVFAARLVFGQGGGGGSGGSTQWLLGQPFGRWLVITLGGVLIGVGIAHIYKGGTAGFEKYLVLPRERMRWLSPICQFGLIARGVVFVIAGGLIVTTAFRYNAAHAPGMESVLETLQSQPYGQALLGLVALGLIAFGVYSNIEAVFRRIKTPGG